MLDAAPAGAAAMSAYRKRRMRVQPRWALSDRVAGWRCQDVHVLDAAPAQAGQAPADAGQRTGTGSTVKGRTGWV